VARNVQGLWEIIQSNNFTVPVDVGPVAQNGTFTIQAMENSSVSGNGSGSVVDGADGEFVHFVITWTNGTQGAYNGAFNPQGVLNGSTFDVKHPGAVTGWHSSKSF
jgi:hypothetical protein